MSKNSDKVKAIGVVQRELGNGFFRVVLNNPADHECICRCAGRLIKMKIQILEGDTVHVELSPYDLDKGRITLRERK